MACQKISCTFAMSLFFTSASAQVGTYTDALLGYPVPEPVNSMEPLSGFRTYESLCDKHMDLVLSSSLISEHQIGLSVEGNPIYAYRISDSNIFAVDASPESGVLINGTIHAREWAAPEIVSQMLSMLVEQYDIDPVITYLVDQNQIVLIPVLNVDGFMQTQRYFNQYYGANGTTGGNSGPDGRMRRKNMYNVDQNLTGTTGDNYFGIDLNRNFPIGWGLNGGSSSTPTNISYRGTSHSTEPETIALKSAIDLFSTPSQLRYYADIHGAIPALYVVYNGNSAADNQIQNIAGRIQNTYIATNGISGSYTQLPVFPGGEIGATDEYFGNTYDIPSFTVEYPIPNYRDHDGISSYVFILPEDEVPEIVEENIKAMFIGFLFASGPPVLQKATIWEDINHDDLIQSGEIVYQSRWLARGFNSLARQNIIDVNHVLYSGHQYNVLLQFNKPIRYDSGNSLPGNWPGQSFPIQPEVEVNIPTLPTISVLPINDGWQANQGNSTLPGYQYYQYDSWLGVLDLSGVVADTQNVKMHVSLQDLAGLALDALPETVTRWDKGWVDYEDAAGEGREGGVDSNIVFQFETENAVDMWEKY